MISCYLIAYLGEFSVINRSGHGITKRSSCLTTFLYFLEEECKKLVMQRCKKRHASE